MELSTKNIQFSKLVAEVHACTKCERMCDSARVLNYSVGNLNAELLFIGEAPGRLGADETEVPFHGDTSGRNFEDLISGSSTFVMGSHGWITWYGLLWQSNGLEGQTA